MIRLRERRDVDAVLPGDAVERVAYAHEVGADLRQSHGLARTQPVGRL